MKNLNLKNVEPYSSFRQPSGGFILEIKDVEDCPADDKQYLKIFYDICDAYDEKDKSFIGMYEKRKEEMNYDYPIHFASYKDKETCRRMFKGFIVAIKESNDGYDFEQTYDEKELIGKRVGAVLQEEEYMGKAKDGSPKIKTRSTIQSIRSVQSIEEGKFKVPELKKLNKSASDASNPFASNSVPTANNPFANNGTAPNPFAQTETPTEAPTNTGVAPAPTNPINDNPFGTGEVF